MHWQKHLLEEFQLSSLLRTGDNSQPPPIHHQANNRFKSITQPRSLLQQCPSTRIIVNQSNPLDSWNSKPKPNRTNLKTERKN